MAVLSSVIYSMAILIGAAEPHSFTMEDLLKHKCDKGKQEACVELQQLQADKEKVEYLDRRVAAFGQTLSEKELMLDERRPDLAAAYPLVMADYFQGLGEIGSNEVLISDAQLKECAAHYHNYWINKKLWWPNDEGKPDWQDIYVFIVDHYYGLCLKRF